MVSGPGVPAGRAEDHMASNIDLAPTFEELAGRTPASTRDGVSLLDLWHGRSPPDWQQAVLVEHHRFTGRGDPDSQAEDAVTRLTTRPSARPTRCTCATPARENASSTT